jgi:hypothetical protein
MDPGMSATLDELRRGRAHGQSAIILFTRGSVKDGTAVCSAEAATGRGLQIVAFVQTGCAPEPGTFPPSARIIEWDFDQRNQKELLAKMREVLR